LTQTVDYMRSKGRRSGRPELRSTVRYSAASYRALCVVAVWSGVRAPRCGGMARGERVACRRGLCPPAAAARWDVAVHVEDRIAAGKKGATRTKVLKHKTSQLFLTVAFLTDNYWQYCSIFICSSRHLLCIHGRSSLNGLILISFWFTWTAGFIQIPYQPWFQFPSGPSCWFGFLHCLVSLARALKEFIKAYRFF